MSTGREKDQKDFDLEQIVKIIDSALESDDQRIKDALRALMTITVLCTAEHPDQTLRNGPLARVFEDYNNLARRLSTLEDDVRKLQWDQQKRQVEPFTPTTPGVGQPWIYPNDTTKPTPMWGPSWSSSSDWGELPDVKKWAAGDDPNYKGSSASTALAEDFLKELEKR
jgi:hypothetical protein